MMLGYLAGAADTLAARREAVERRFSDWHMGYRTAATL